MNSRKEEKHNAYTNYKKNAYAELIGINCTAV
jgi:hypothetical protein